MAASLRRGAAGGRRALVRALHGTQFLLQVLDFVAQARGDLELEVLGGGHHLGGELFDEVGELGLRALTRIRDGRALRSGPAVACALLLAVSALQEGLRVDLLAD